MMNAESRRERQREELRTAILDAARDAFLAGGVENFSMRNLAARVGCSPGTLYLHFENKSDILRSLVDEGMDRLLAALDRAHDSRDSIQSLRNKLRAYVDFGRELPNHYHFAFIMHRVRTGETIRPHVSFDVLREAVARCVEQGPFRSLDVETTSQVLWSTIHGITSLLIVNPEFPWIGKHDLIDEVIDNAIRGLSSRAAPAGDEEGRS